MSLDVERYEQMLAQMNAPVEAIKARMRQSGIVEKADGTYGFEGTTGGPSVHLADIGSTSLHTMSIAATLAAGIIANGKSSFNATPEGAIDAYRAVLDALEKR